MSAARYFHTLRYLRAQQLLARARFVLYRPAPRTGGVPQVRTVPGTYSAPIAGPAVLLSADTVRLLNVEGRCASESDWRPRARSALWTYHLHYFDELNAQDAARRRGWQRDLIERWVAHNPPAQGPGWDPYPTSRRIVNWVKWELTGEPLAPSCRASLAAQARWLRSRLEYHLLGNHLLANACALVHAGLYFTGREAQEWFELGVRLLEGQLPEQVLPDGGHFERSPMYHAAVLENLLDLVNLLAAYGRVAPAQWLAVIARMRRWLKVMSHPDGQIAFFNDAAFGMAPDSAQIEAYATRLGLAAAPEPDEALIALQPSGYVRAREGPGWLICDCAPVGPDHQPGHAHADTLSFELSLRGARVFVNSGTSAYGSDAERQRQRGTAAHNTVVIDDGDSSEVWAGFRVARRARPHLRAAEHSDAQSLIVASHDGYRRLSGRNEHERRWRLTAAGLRIEDRIAGGFRRAEARLHLHPRLRARLDGREAICLEAPDGDVARVSFTGAAAVTVAAGTWHPRFGAVEDNQVIAVLLAGDSLRTDVQWPPSS